MAKRILFLLKYFIYWVLFFETGRILFFILTFSQSSQFGISILVQSMTKALWLDGSIAGYFTLLAALIALVSIYLPKPSGIFLKWLHVLLLITCSLAIIVNAVIYTYWAGPLDSSTLKYLETPAEAAASIDWLLMIIPIILGIGLFMLYHYLFKQFLISNTFENVGELKTKVLSSFLLLFLAGLCIIPIRGGIGVVPVNLSYVYFHKSIYPNHAAYNPVWNTLYTYTESKKHQAYSYTSDSLASQRFAKLYTPVANSDIWLKKSKPNVIVIVLESFLSKLIGLKENGIEVTPNLNQLTQTGIYFNNLYAAGDRSDKGLAAIFSGLPALPKSSFVQFPKVFPQIPSIYKDFAKNSYSTSFYYGGNLDFANLRSYFIATGVQTIISNDEMPKTIERGRWGIHDEFMFLKFLNDLKQMRSPFISTLFTLSNHEPFDLPGKLKFGNANGDLAYKSTAFYTDACLGDFISKLKQMPLWQNTLVVLVADHGVARLQIDKIFDEEKFHIPMIWTGGVIEKANKIETICSQTDIPQFLLSQCRIVTESHYRFSKNISTQNKSPFAIYIYNDGIGMITPKNVSIYDNISKQFQNDTSIDSIMNYGKAHLQIASQILNK